MSSGHARSVDLSEKAHEGSVARTSCSNERPDPWNPGRVRVHPPRSLPGNNITSSRSSASSMVPRTCRPGSCRSSLPPPRSGYVSSLVGTPSRSVTMISTPADNVTTFDQSRAARTAPRAWPPPSGCVAADRDNPAQPASDRPNSPARTRSAIRARNLLDVSVIVSPPLHPTLTSRLRPLPSGRCVGSSFLPGLNAGEERRPSSQRKTRSAPSWNFLPG